ncbi:MAG: [Fe-Fe] hydrogenase large subunit C-terminal domain-containing protein [Capsulimonadaceae bacterium]|nr:[Fe-Fe] hydrogenase large subunit C-terminal domain-containing protein [Capsulimonadaceae bacterium]
MVVKIDARKPIYSEPAQCQDCYKCIRECPVKAIRVSNNQASIVPDLCIVCGHCASVCPSGAKRVRDDVSILRNLLAQRAPVIVSLAPSFASEFAGVLVGSLIHAIKELGFHAVSETALGAQEVSARVAMDVDASVRGRLFLSSACPVAVELIGKYLPEHAHQITQVLSPLLSHCRLLKKHYGQDAKIVFFGPCIAKKLEAEAHPELLSAALTFEDLRGLFADIGIDPRECVGSSNDVFEPCQAAEGALYPIEGGMLDATRVHSRSQDVRFMSLSGIVEIDKALRGSDLRDLDRSVFLELLACEGGCVNGPKASARSAVLSRLSVLDFAHFADAEYPRSPEIEVADSPSIAAVETPSFDDDAIAATLRSVGKHSESDELNCGGCGYHSCRELAAAILSGKAEISMCVSYMRDLAHKKANAILRTVPYATVLVGEALDIIECNGEFVRLGGEDIVQLAEAAPDLAGVRVSAVVPFIDLFEQVLRTGEDIIRKYIRIDETVLSVTIFTLEPHRVVGAIMIDVTNTELRREQIVEKAQLVIQNMLHNVQDIAFRLGKSSAESEIILDSIIDGFSPTHYERTKDDGS